MNNYLENIFFFFNFNKTPKHFIPYENNVFLNLIFGFRKNLFRQIFLINVKILNFTKHIYFNSNV